MYVIKLDKRCKYFNYVAEIVLMENYSQSHYLAVKGWRPENVPEAYLNIIGIFESFGNFHWRQNFARVCMIHYITGGAGVMEIAGKRYEALPGSMLVFFPGESAVYYDLPGQPWRYIWLNIAGKKAEQILKQCGVSRNRHCLQVPDIRAFSVLLREIHHIYESREYGVYFPALAIWRIFDYLSGLGDETAAAPSGTELVNSCRELIDSGQPRLPAVNELARTFQVDRATIFRAFKQNLGMSPKAYIEQIRLDRAANLLREGKMSIKQVAAVSGYSDPGYFSVAFKRKFGVMPSKFRESRFGGTRN